MPWQALLFSLGVILLSTGLRYQTVGLRHAAPFPLAGVLSPGLAIAAGLVLFVAAAVPWSRSRARRESPGTTKASASQGAAIRRAERELLVFPGIFLLVWAWIPSDSYRPVHYLVLTLVALLLIGLMLKEDGWRELTGSSSGFQKMARFLALPTALAVAGWILLVLLLTRFDLRHLWQTLPHWHRVLVSLLSYPLYAFLQLSLFLVFAMRRLRAIGASPRAQLLVPASLFAFIHWPNGLIMLFAFLAMLVWALSYRRWRSLPAIALSMAILATVITQAPLENLTEHLRTGPGFVYDAYLQELYRYQGALERKCLQTQGSVAEDSAVYFREILNQADSSPAFASWVASWERVWREWVATDFHRAVAKDTAKSFDEAYCQEQGRLWASEERWQDCERKWRVFIATLYREVADREGAPEEIEGWSSRPNLGMRRMMIHRLFQSPEYFALEGTPAWRLAHLAPLLPPRASDLVGRDLNESEEEE